MANTIGGRFKNAWTVFSNRGEPEKFESYGSEIGPAYSVRPDRTRLQVTNERSIIASIYNRISIDVASLDMKHVRLDDEDRYLKTIKSGLNDCLTLEANIDQGARAFRQDVVMSMFDNGAAAIVPVDTDISPQDTSGYEILSLRVGEITQWHPQHVRVSVYNDRTGLREEVLLPKHMVAIVENPLYTVMNQPNSTLQRLAQKLNMLDAVDQQSSSGKLDIIIQLPYVIKSEARREQAEQRRKDIEMQLKGSKYGIAYTDGTEKITQLNRAAENNLLKQVQYLTEMLYSQLGITPQVMDGTADEKTMLNYHNRTVEPILAAMTEAMKRTFLTKTGRTQGQSVMYFRDPFRLVPIGEIAEIADKFTRNEIASSNEMRGAIGWTPAKDPKADELRNSNMPIQEPSAPIVEVAQTEETKVKEGELRNES